jgi:flagellar hook protein FlgE
MVHSPDITDPIPYALSNPQSQGNYAVTSVQYDVAIGGQPFFLETSDETPYRRVTAQYRKQQLDTTREPGEQTLTGWWLRSQSSFHLGQGVKFFEPQQDESLRFQYTYSKGCNVWEKGQVTLLKTTNSYSAITNNLQTSKRPYQSARSIRYSTKDAVLVWDGYKINKVEADGTVVSFVNYTSGTDYPILAVCDDGTYAYWVTNKTGTNRLQVNKRPLDSSAAASEMFTHASITATNAVIEFTKERLVMAVNNSVYEFATSATVLPTAVYSHPNAAFTYTSITSSGAAIYLSGYNGIQSTIQKFTLTTAGAMPTLTSAITAAELPVGEIIQKVYYYLGYMAIGTSLGLRMAQVSDTDGSIAYGPLIFESSQPVYDVAGYDKYLWCTTNVDGNPGVTRVNLGQQITSLVFSYAWDLYDPALTNLATTACAFVGNTARLAFVSANNGTTNGKVYIESETDLVPTAELRTGFIRYNTLEDKNFKLLTPRFDTTNGALQILSVDQYGTNYNIGTFAQGAGLDQVGIPYPNGPQQYIAFAFAMTRSSLDATKGPIFTGYQVNALPSIPRQRLIQYPVMCFDSESDRFNNKSGYEGAAYTRMSSLEQIENVGDIIRIQDFRTGESYLGLIEELDFTNKTPTDKRFSGYGGVLLVTIRSI